MHQPIKTLLYLVITFFSMAVLSVLYPKDGITVTDKLTFRFPEFSSFFSKPAKKKDISEIIQLADKLNAQDSILHDHDTLSGSSDADSAMKAKLITSIQYKQPAVLHAFFEALANLKNDPKSIRVLHYGDSQIESDRITDYLRMKLQGQFGGNGPGMTSLLPVSQGIACRVVSGTGWDRYQTFTAKDKRVKHSNYGPTGGFTRYLPYRQLTDTTSVFSTKITITTNKMAGSNNVGYKRLKLYYGGAQCKTWCELYDGPALAGADSLAKGGYFNMKEFNITPGSVQHELRFSGKDSPDFYAFSLESDHGVYVDNIAQRGSSGTFFHHLNFSQLKSFYDYLNVKLVILQYGGNALPAIKSKENAVNFASYFKGQIAIVKKAAPGASILFIGPADMSVKEGTEYVTHPYLEDTRTALKNVVLEMGCAYFDMYDCMGGKNSMPTWVSEKLAAEDYIHFSPQGARKMATLLYSSLLSNYNSFIKNKPKK